jgi:DNA-binding transcriptional MocR family regulator
MIHRGTMQHLDPAPSESTLVQAYGVSRGTVRDTMVQLREEGIVFTVPTAESQPAFGRGGGRTEAGIRPGPAARVSASAVW